MDADGGPWEWGQEDWRLYPEDQRYMMEVDQDLDVEDDPQNDQVFPLDLNLNPEDEDDDDDDPVQIEQQIVHIRFADEQQLHHLQFVDLESVGQNGVFQHRLGIFEDVNQSYQEQVAFGRSGGAPDEDQQVPTAGARAGQPGRVEEESANPDSAGEMNLEAEDSPLTSQVVDFFDGSEVSVSLLQPAESSPTLP